MPRRLFISEAGVYYLSLVMYRARPHMKIEAHMASDKYEKASAVVKDIMYINVSRHL